MLFLTRYRAHLIIALASLLTGLLWGFTIDVASLPLAMLAEFPMLAAMAWILLNNERLEKELDNALADRRTAWAESDRAGYVVHQRNQTIAKLWDALAQIVPAASGNPLIADGPKAQSDFNITLRPMLVARAIRGVLSAGGDPVSPELIATWATARLREREPGDHQRITVEEAIVVLHDWPQAKRDNGGRWTIGKAMVKA